MTKKIKVSQKSNDTRKKIIDASFRIMNKKGVEEFNVRNICKEAGISVGGFYYHFESIEGIISEAYKLDSVIKELYENNQLLASTEEKVLHIFEGQMDYALNYGIPLLVIHYHNLLNNVGKIDDLYLKESRYLLKCLTTILSEGKSIGDISDQINEKEFASLLIMSTRGILFSWCLSNGTINLKERVEEIVLLLMKSATTNR